MNAPTIIIYAIFAVIFVICAIIALKLLGLLNEYVILPYLNFCKNETNEIAKGFAKTTIKVMQEIQDSISPLGHIIYLVEIAITISIVILAIKEIGKVIEANKGNKQIARANMIALMIGLLIDFLLFKEHTSLIDQLPQINNMHAKYILTGAGLSAGWSVWYLCKIHKYVDFFSIALLVITIGTAILYAISGFTGSTEPKILYASFVVASLFRISIILIENQGQPN